MSAKVKFVLFNNNDEPVDETTVIHDFIPRVGETISIMYCLGEVIGVHYEYTYFAGNNVLDEVTVNIRQMED